MTVIVRHLGLQDYRNTWQGMEQFNLARGPETADEIWLLQHSPVFTLGLNGKKQHILNQGDIPVVETDRGGQVTYHGPGQLIVYTLFDVRRSKMGIRDMVSRLERSVIELLASHDIMAATRPKAPGVYVADAKIASLGLRVKRGGCYHGLSLNVDMDLSPFGQINPCGYEGLQVTSTREQGLEYTLDEVARNYLPFLCQQFEITTIKEIHE